MDHYIPDRKFSTYTRQNMELTTSNNILSTSLELDGVDLTSEVMLPSLPKPLKLDYTGSGLPYTLNHETLSPNIDINTLSIDNVSNPITSDDDNSSWLDNILNPIKNFFTGGSEPKIKLNSSVPNSKKSPVSIRDLDTKQREILGELFWENQKDRKASIILRGDSNNSEIKYIEFTIKSITKSDRESISMFEGFGFSYLQSFGSRIPVYTFEVSFLHNPRRAWYGNFLNMWEYILRASQLIGKGYTAELYVGTDSYEIVPFNFSRRQGNNIKYVVDGTFNAFILNKNVYATDNQYASIKGTKKKMEGTVLVGTSEGSGSQRDYTDSGSYGSTYSSVSYGESSSGGYVGEASNQETVENTINGGVIEKLDMGKLATTYVAQDGFYKVDKRIKGNAEAYAGAVSGNLEALEFIEGDGSKYKILDGEKIPYGTAKFKIVTKDENGVSDIRIIEKQVPKTVYDSAVMGTEYKKRSELAGQVTNQTVKAVTDKITTYSKGLSTIVRGFSSNSNPAKTVSTTVSTKTVTPKSGAQSSGAEGAGTKIKPKS